MRIGSFGDYGGFLQNYKTPVIPQVSVEEVQRQDMQKAAEEQVVPQIPREETPAVTPVRHDAAIEDISLTFNKQESFDYVGSESDINDLDMQKAISDMQKDQMFKQYQYFVGSAKNLFVDNGDGTVIPK